MPRGALGVVVNHDAGEDGSERGGEEREFGCGVDEIFEGEIGKEGCGGNAPRRATRRLGSLLPLAVVVAFGATACNGIIGSIDGSGVAETSSIDVEQFDEIDVNGAFDVEITVQDGPASVEVTVDDNLIDYLEVEVVGDQLNVGFEWGNYDFGVQPTAIISVPSLTALEVSGASEATVDGVAAETFDLEVSGASNAVVDIETSALSVEVSGASNVVLSGDGDTLTLDGSGASTIDLLDFSAELAEIDLSGASDADLGQIRQVDGELSGASNLSAAPDTDVSVRTSGAANVDWR